MIIDRENRRLLIHQSWLSDFTTDPERARLAMLHPEMNRNTDVASLGTGTHAAIEQHLLGELQLRDMVAYAQHVATETIAEDNIDWIDLTPESYVAHAGFLTQAWINELSFYVPRGGQPEAKFLIDTGRTAAAPDGTVFAIWFEGTIDYIPPDPTTQGVWDWKTAGRAYMAWEKQRWAIQPSVYSHAVVNGELVSGVSYPLDFHYGIMIRGEKKINGITHAAPGKTQWVNVRRFHSHGEWVTEQAVTAAQFVLSYGIEQPWPRNDNHTLCSEKWCSWWTKCKGSHVSHVELTWKP